MELQALSRRSFLKLTGLSGTGLILGFRWQAWAETGGASTFVPNVFIEINEQAGVVLHIPIPEIGQNIRTTFAMLLADELGADLDRVHLVQAPPDVRYGHQTAGGSQSVRKQFLNLRRAGAAAREMLLAAAGREWDIPPEECRAEKGYVVSSDGKNRVLLEELAENAVKETVPADPPLKKNDGFTYIGKPTPSLDLQDIVTGRTTYSMDARPEGLLYAAVVRSPVHRGSLASYDDGAARKIAGVVDVVRFGDKVGVVAKDSWSAQRGAALLSVEWDDGSNAGSNSRSYDEQRRRALDTGKVLSNSTKGSFEETFKDAPQQVEAEFELPILAHAPMEPPNATAYVTRERAELWVGSQNLNALRRDLEKMVGLPAEAVTYHQLHVGGGFGRKLRNDFIEEAIAISKAIGKPVQVVFSRTDDLRHSHYREAVTYRWRAGLDEKGKPSALALHSSQRLRNASRRLLRFAAHTEARVDEVPMPLRGGPLRSPRHNADCFADETFLDIMAEKAGHDPLLYRLALYGDADALKSVGWPEAPVSEPVFVQLLKVVEERSGWKSDPQMGYGVATFSGYGSNIAVVALAPRRRAKKPVSHFFAAVSCGLAINPLGVEGMVAGGLLDGLGAALHQEITLNNGRVVQGNFDDYPLLSMREAPEVDVYIVPSDEKPGGLGEVPYPPAFPAVCNALSDAHGRRITRLPVNA